MPRPTTKADLLAAAQTQYDKLWSLLDSLPEPAQTAPFTFGEDPKRKEAHWQRDKNLRDVLIHLVEWHNLLLAWVPACQSGAAVPFLPVPYNWRTYGEMNAGFWQKHQSTSLAQAKTLLQQSHAQTMALIEGFTNEELFESKHFPWTGNSCLGAYCVSTTSSHYAWAIKKLKLHQKTCYAAQNPQTPRVGRPC